MSLSYVTLTADVFDGQGNLPASGTAVFTPTAVLTDTTNHEVIAQLPVTCSFRPGGVPTVRLLATDNATAAPAGWAWKVSFTGSGMPSGWTFFLPFSGGAAQNLSSLAPVSTVATSSAYLPVFSTAAYGATGNGTTDDTGAVQAAIGAAATAGGGVVYFPRGTYLISSTLTVTANGITLQGAGSFASVIKAAAGMASSVMVQLGNGSVTIADCNVYDLMFDSAVQKTSNAALDVNKGLRTRFQRLRTYHQFTSIHVHNSTITWVTDCDLRDQSADGIAFDSDIGSGFDLYITDVIADNPVVSNSGNGINWSGGENLVVHNCDFLHFTVGLLIAPGSSRQCRWGFFSAAEFDTSGDNCWKLSNASGDIAGVTFTNCWAGTATNYGILIDGSGGGGILAGVRLEACKIVHNGLAGIRLISGATDTSVVGCDIIANSQTVSNTRSGIEVTAGTSDFLIEGCRIGNGWGQGSTQSNGINFDAGGTNHFAIVGNDLRGNVNQAVNGLSGVTGTDGKVAQNVGYNPVGSLGPPSVPATTSPFTNPYNVDVTAYVTAGAGGTTAVAVGGTSMMTIPTSGIGTVRIAAGQSVTLTYTSAPTWKWAGD